MGKNIKFYHDDNNIPCARGPLSEKLLTVFLETDIQGDTIILNALMDDIWAVENGHSETREFFGNAHTVTLTIDSATIQSELDEAEPSYTTKLKHLTEVLQDWEAFI